MERSVRTALEAEQAAFQSGDCELAMSFVGDRTPLFAVSRRVIPTKGALVGMWGRMAGPRLGADRTLEGHAVHVLSSVAAYTITTYAVATEAPNGEQATSPQIVTKIWESIDGAWGIVHFHESAR
jgi:ketosteroid isomerase-like protein